jgi:hypothetical protein
MKRETEEEKEETLSRIKRLNKEESDSQKKERIKIERQRQIETERGTER